MRNEKGQFIKGLTPWNKGLKGSQEAWNKGLINSTGYHPNTVKNQFPKGHLPHNHKPIGSERVDSEGYTYRKIADTRNKKNDWRMVHVLLWEQHNGAISDNHVVIFKDGNKKNIGIDNLELISRSELMRRNTIHRYPPELKEVIRLNNKLRKAINE